MEDLIGREVLFTFNGMKIRGRVVCSEPPRHTISFTYRDGNSDSSALLTLNESEFTLV